MRQFRVGECRIMVATDVSARGIDIADVGHVINYDLPEKVENYVHRVGRTGRGMSKGIAISFCSIEERELLEEIQEFLNKPIEILNINKEDYAATLALSPEAVDLKSLVSEHDAWLNKKKPKKRKKK